MSPALWRALSTHMRPVSAIPRRRMHDGFAALNIYKDPTAAPKELDDAAYPDWLWRVQHPQPTREDLLREASAHYARGGYDELFRRMPEPDMKRLFRLDARDRIRTENFRRKGGTVV